MTKSFKDNIIVPYRRTRQWLGAFSGGFLGYLSFGASVGGQVIIQTLYSLLFMKFLFIASGLKIGWSMCSRFWTEQFCIESFIHDKNIWKILHKEINLKEEQFSQLSKLQKKQIINEIYDPNTQIGAIYNTGIIVFLERYNRPYLNTFNDDTTCKQVYLKQISKEYKNLLYFLRKKLPMLSKQEIELIVNKDIYPYIYGYYLLFQEEKLSKKKNLIDPKYDYLLKIITPILANITLYKHPQEKIEILKDIISKIEEEYRNKNWGMLNCDELIPMLCYILDSYPKCLPGADICMVYDYYCDSLDRDGYIATLWKSALTSTYSK